MPPGLFDRDVPLSGLLARVVLERGMDHAEGLTYAVPTAIADLQVGERVRAPLGRGDKPAEGYVIEVFRPDLQRPIPGPDPARIKPLLGRAQRHRNDGSGGAAGTAPQLTPALVRLALWMSGYYCTPLGMVLAAIVPAAVKRQIGRVSVRLVERVEGAALDPAQKLPPSARAVWEAIQALPPDALPASPRDLARRLSIRTTAPLGRLVKAGLLRLIDSERVRVRTTGGGWGIDPQPDLPPALTADQTRAVDAVTASLGQFRPFLLHGVTGSGKTEVYLHALAAAQARGPAIVLVPEIALTPQTSARFLARFGPGTVAVMHSGLTEAQRHHEWARVASGKARIIVGARSAIFAPCPDAPALIIVDEEHDGSYKQDQLPRYHARDVALRRAQIEGCPVILGSATPSLESWHNAMSRSRGGAERFQLLSLPRRVAGGRLPPVEIIDLVEAQRQRPRDRHQHALTPRLEHEINRTLAGNGQIILLLNRRGFASYICCADASCGWFLQCKHCDVTAVYHRERAAAGDVEHYRVVKCHHCLAEQKLPSLCPVCSKTVSHFGFGTQRLEDEIHRKFPALARDGALLRLDADTMRRASDYFDALERFRAGQARCLMGTQMIAKGLDFPGVELIGVINADTGLSLPDFRAAERTFQLVSQVAGRAGRSGASAGESRVLVQTMSPREPAITLAAAHDYAAFAERELEFRREAGLPPVGRMARIVCRDEKPEKAEARAHEVAAALREAAAGSAGNEASALRIKGPMPCPIARVAGHYRFAVELLAEGAPAIQRALASLRSAGVLRSDARTAVDVDPIALL